MYVRCMFTSAKQMAPRMPANHMTTCILGDICRPLRKRFAAHDRGKMLKQRVSKQRKMQIAAKEKFQWRNRPVKMPIPMNRYTKKSHSTRKDLKMLCAVTCEVDDRLKVL